MDFYRIKASVRLAALATGLVYLGIASSQTQPDNTKMNKGDGSKSAVTADQQKMNASDRTLTQKIRKSVISDKSLSTYAHNVKIISQNGMVTLKGPVRSDDEKKSIVAKAVDAAGSADKVTDQMTVAPSSK
jgi:hyperosmotically inducible periplasmic protein